jgi:hypothetical protein
MPTGWCSLGQGEASRKALPGLTVAWPAGEPAHAEHRERAEQRAERHAPGQPVRPQPGRQRDGQAGRQPRHDRIALADKAETAEREASMAATERRELGRDRQRPALGNPVGKLEKGPRVTVHNQLGGIRPELPDAETGRDQKRSGQAPEGGPARGPAPGSGPLPGRGSGPAAGKLPAGQQHQPDRERHRDQHHRDREEPASQQQGQAGQQPGGDHQRGQDGDDRERLAARIGPPVQPQPLQAERGQPGALRGGSLRSVALGRPTGRAKSQTHAIHCRAGRCRGCRADLSRADNQPIPSNSTAYHWVLG